jgi:hypothetical protein
MNVGIDSAHRYKRGEQDEKYNRDALVSFLGAALVGFDA